MKLSRNLIANKIASQTLKSGFDETSIKQIAELLLKTKRTGDVNSLVRDIQLQWSRSGKVIANITSAHTLTAQVKEDIKGQIRKIYGDQTEVIISEQIDPKLIGGIKIETADKELDLSVRAKLNNFRQLVSKRA